MKLKTVFHSTPTGHCRAPDLGLLGSRPSLFTSTFARLFLFIVLSFSWSCTNQLKLKDLGTLIGGGSSSVNLLSSGTAIGQNGQLQSAVKEPASSGSGSRGGGHKGLASATAGAAATGASNSSSRFTKADLVFMMAGQNVTTGLPSNFDYDLSVSDPVTSNEGFGKVYLVYTLTLSNFNQSFSLDGVNITSRASGQVVKLSFPTISIDVNPATPRSSDLGLLNSGSSTSSLIIQDAGFDFVLSPAEDNNPVRSQDLRHSRRLANREPLEAVKISAV